MISNRKEDKEPSGSKRSTEWPKVRGEFLRLHPTCAVCGGKKKLEVHHMRPFHTNPELELDLRNLITLCENDKDGVNCHLLFGHLGNFKSFNEHVIGDAADWKEKILTRPK